MLVFKGLRKSAFKTVAREEVFLIDKQSGTIRSRARSSKGGDQGVRSRAVSGGQTGAIERGSQGRLIGKENSITSLARLLRPIQLHMGQSLRVTAPSQIQGPLNRDLCGRARISYESTDRRARWRPATVDVDKCRRKRRLERSCWQQRRSRNCDRWDSSWINVPIENAPTGVEI